jgi:hypothetical protein
VLEVVELVETSTWEVAEAAVVLITKEELVVTVHSLELVEMVVVLQFQLLQAIVV